jgi:hypothetical protein
MGEPMEIDDDATLRAKKGKAPANPNDYRDAVNDAAPWVRPSYLPPLLPSLPSCPMRAEARTGEGSQGFARGKGLRAASHVPRTAPARVQFIRRPALNRRDLQPLRRGR